MQVAELHRVGRKDLAIVPFSETAQKIAPQQNLDAPFLKFMDGRLPIHADQAHAGFSIAVLS